MRTGVTIVGLISISAACTAHAQNAWAPTEVQKVTVYACPGHPQIMATWPARCPYCNSTLRPVAAAGGAARGGGSSAAAGGQTGSRAGAVSPQGQQGAGTSGRSDMDRGFQSEGRGEESREQGFPGEGFEEPFEGDEFGEEGSRGPEDVFPGDRFGFNDEFAQPGFEDEFGRRGFSDEFSQPGFGNEGFGER